MSCHNLHTFNKLKVKLKVISLQSLYLKRSTGLTSTRLFTLQVTFCFLKISQIWLKNWPIESTITLKVKYLSDLKQFCNNYLNLNFIWLGPSGKSHVLTASSFGMDGCLAMNSADRSVFNLSRSIITCGSIAHHYPVQLSVKVYKPNLAFFVYLVKVLIG